MRALVASIVLAACLAAPARADDAAPDLGAALAHLQQGVEAFRAGDYRLAHEQFQQARRLAPDKPNPYRWLALTEVQLGDCPRALVNIEAFLSRVPRDDPRVAELVRLREMCQQTGVLNVDSTPPRVSLRLDGADLGTTPYRGLSVAAGDHTLEARRDGYTTRSRPIRVPAGGALDIHLELDRAAAPITRRWWFWPVVVGAAVTVTGVAIWATDDPADTILPPIRCDSTGCSPLAP
jgi:tetratricopeptide (TPR) repeat protein